MILLFTDFGHQGPYLGEMTAQLAAAAPGEPVIDLMHDAPAHAPKPAAYLLAALAPRMPEAAVCLAVVDPGVGGDRRPLVVEADGRFFVGPDNGLLAPLCGRAKAWRAWTIRWRPENLSASFHGRDLFAPVAAELAVNADRAIHRLCRPLAAEDAKLAGHDWPDQLPEVIHRDRFGNLMTGFTAAKLGEDARLEAGGEWLARAQTFAEVRQGALFWYENSCGLAEIAGNRISAADTLEIDVGEEVTVVDG